MVMVKQAYPFKLPEYKYNRLKVEEMDYVDYCPTGSLCTYNGLKAFYEKYKESPALKEPEKVSKEGTFRIEKERNGVPSFMNYRCCSGCFLPIDEYEAAKVNKWLENKKEYIPDTEFLELLNGYES